MKRILIDPNFILYSFALNESVLDEEGNAIVAPEDNRPKSIEDEDPGSWDENYKSHHDSKPNGPQAIALDFSFPEARVLFGKLILFIFNIS